MAGMMKPMKAAPEAKPAKMPAAPKAKPFPPATKAKKK